MENNILISHERNLDAYLSKKISGLLALPNFEIEIRDAWASTQTNHRSAIRQYLLEQYNFNPDVLNLDELPKSDDYSVSISHCKVQGAAALSQPSCSLGIDLEMTERVRDDLVLRVCRLNEEFNAAPFAAALWAAKEASYKALCNASFEPKVLKNITVGSWQILEPEFTGYEFEFGEIQGRGVLVNRKPAILAVSSLELREKV